MGQPFLIIKFLPRIRILRPKKPSVTKFHENCNKDSGRRKKSAFDALWRQCRSRGSFVGIIKDTLREIKENECTDKPS